MVTFYLLSFRLFGPLTCASLRPGFLFAVMQRSNETKEIIGGWGGRNARLALTRSARQVSGSRPGLACHT